MTKRRRGGVGVGMILVLMAAGVGSISAAPDGPADKNDSPATELTRDELVAHVRKIDELVNRDLREHHQRPNPSLDDSLFLRRIYLDITGTIPTLEQAKDFISSNARRKRSDLIDELLDSPGYASHSFNYFADLLRITTRLNENVSGRTYIDWVKQSLRENEPYDKFVYEMLTATGRPHENGATGYYLRDSGMPLDNTANTVRVFLGTSIGCAMCHDHPFDKWSQLEFYEMSAFTYGTRTRANDPVKKQINQLVREQDKKENQRLANTLRRLSQIYSYRLHDTGRKVHLPKDYQYSDADPGDAVDPFTIFGNVVEEPAEGETIREAYARWLTSKENPRFAKVIANRLWKRAFGLGLIEPVGEITDQTEAANPELMEYLTQLMKDLDFDMRQYLRVLYNTRAYQREASREELDPEKVYHFPGPILRRMTAEQIWDSMVTLAVPNIDSRMGAFRDYWYTDAELQGKSDSQILAYARKMMNGGGGGAMMGAGRSGAYANMVRASELPSPAPAGHFLWRFGQSDRQLIQNASPDPSVTQVLTLLNGPIDRVLLKDKSVLYENVVLAGSVSDKLDVIWLSILSRFPTRAERAVAIQEVRAHGDVAFDNLVWALLNTREFMFVQ